MASVGTEQVFRTDLFGVVAPSIGWVPPLRYLLRRARILELLGFVPSGDAVEVGCGAGALLEDLSRCGFSVTGLETSCNASMMARTIIAQSSGTQIIVDEPASEWAGTKCLVCAFDVIEHIEDDTRALCEWISWLRAGGYIMLSVPAHRRNWGAGDEWAGHWRRYDRADLMALLASQGLVVEHIECYGFPLANLTEWFGTKVYRRMLAERGNGVSREEASANSGIERSSASKIFRLVNTPAGRVVFRLCLWLQSITARSDWGSGYLVLARCA